MRLTTTGDARNFGNSVIGRITNTDLPLELRGDHVRFMPEGSIGTEKMHGYRAVISHQSFVTDIPVVDKLRETLSFRDGDVVAIEPSGFVRSLYRPHEKHHSLFVTERCSSNCLMCSQPPKDVDDVPSLTERNRELLHLMKPKPEYLTITGGEPTLLGDRLFDLLTVAQTVLPETEVHILTNGRTLAWPEFCRRIAGLSYPRLSFGIPLYSDFAGDHDYIVQAKGAFDQTVSGLHQAARNGLRIEIRVVLHKLTIPRLTRLVEYIFRNLPFVEHVALMGLEYVGYTARNADELWIDPFEYQDELVKAVQFLQLRDMPVSIYNHQLCVLRPNLWPYAKKSISDWKSLYLPECEKCAALDQCGGLFQWASKKHSEHIHAFEEVEIKQQDGAKCAQI
jgi:His-Xaa-Ser system radical SAM maturase HxsC